MSFIAILGAGAIGGALAHRLAARGRIHDVRVIDLDGSIAQGKALDILQSAPIEQFSTRISSAGSIEAAAGAQVIVLADAAKGDIEYAGETGLAVVRRLSALDSAATFLFAAAAQRELMARTISELRVDRRRVIGSAPGALESAIRALTALELDATGVEVQLRIVGVPPHAAVIAWEEATVFGQPISAHVPAHRLAAIASRVGRLWPPGPFALASAASRVAEALMLGSRRRYTCFVSLENPPGRGAIVAMPVELGPQGLENVVEPSLTRQERTMFENALALT